MLGNLIEKLGPVVPVHKGAWSAETQYLKQNIVTHQGSSYIAIQDSKGSDPSTSPTSWKLLAERGPVGAAGAEGPRGTSVVNTEINEEGHLVLTLSSDSADAMPIELPIIYDEVSDNSASTNSAISPVGVKTETTKLKGFIDNKIAKTGQRGVLAGSESATKITGSCTINSDSSDTLIISTSGATTLTFTPALEEVTSIKLIALKATADTTLSISGAVWANAGSAPKWGTSGKNLVLVATFVAGRVVLNVFDNEEA